MKIYIDFSKQAITKTDSDVAYVGDVYSNVFELLFFNYGDNADWFPTMSQLAPNGREAGDFSADALEEDETYDYVEDGVTYKRYTFTIGDGWVRMKGRSNFFIWVNKLVDSNALQRKCYGKLNVALNESTDNYFIQDVYLNPKVKEYIDNTIGDDLEDYKSTIDDEVETQNETIASLIQASPSVFDTASNIGNLQENKGVAVATDTGYIYYWDSTLATPAYVSSGLQYNSLANYVKHSGNQLQDANGNNFYPTLANNSIGKALVNNTIVKQLGYANYKNFNTAKKNSIIIYSSLQSNSSEYSNYPVAENGTLITLNGYDGMSDSNNIGDIQLYISYTNKYYFRSTVAGNWTAWSKVATYDEVSKCITTLWNSYTTYKDFNNVPNNSVITYANSDFTGYSNYPVAVSGTLLTLNAFNTSLPQIAKTQYYLTNTNRLFTRISWGGGGTFTAWKEYTAYDGTLYTHIYDDYIHPNYDFNNKSIVFFGDSITYGTISGGRTTKPYPTLFGESFTNCTTYNEAVAGSTIYNDGTHTYLRTQLENSTHKTDVDYVFIASGVNDWGYKNSLANVKTAIESDIDYVLSNYTNAKIIIITPIEPNYTKSDEVATIQEYRNIITESAIMKDYQQNKISVVQGIKFDFPKINDNLAFRNAMYSDGLHPTTMGYETVYINGLLKALRG